MKKSGSLSAASKCNELSNSVAADGQPGSETKSLGAEAVTAEVHALRSALPISVDQCRALESLMSGKSMSQAAQAAGVGRTTLYRWMNEDFDFRAAHNAWKRDTMAASHTSVLAFADPAIRTIARALDAGDVKTGLTILKSLGLLSRPTVGSTNADGVRREQQIEQKERGKKRTSAKMDADNLPM